MTDKPKALAVAFDAIPTSLKAIPRWVLWKYVKDGKGWKKLPCQVTGKPASSTDPKTWSTYDDVADELLMGNYDGIGIAIDGSDDFHGFDIDDCVVDGELNDVAKELLEHVDGYAEVSPSGTGIKLFTRSNLAISGAKKPVEVYREGRYFAVTGHRINGHDDLPTQLQDVGWFVEKHLGRQATEKLDALALYKPPLVDWDLERVRAEIAPYIKDVDSYEGWLKVGMVLHHQGQAGLEWMDLWDEISRQSEHYDREEIVAKWDSFSEQRDRGQGALTLASLIKAVGEVKAEERKQRFDEYKQQIAEVVGIESLRDEVCLAIQKDFDLDRLSRDVLAQLLKAKFKELGFPVGLPDVKRLIKPKAKEGVPQWLEDWAYITHEDKFFNVSTKRKVTVSGFNAMYNREVGGMDTETKAAVIALDLYGIPTPDKIIYLPNAPELFDLNGVPCANGYDPESPPSIPAVMGRGDLDAVELVKQHLVMILTEPNAVDTMIAWMAHNVQRPGVKIRWAPLIKGIEGDGKTVLGKIMSYVMGHVNVGTVSPTVLATQFTGWADGRCVNVLEEIRMVGHNRHDILNMVKPYITNDVVTIHPKGVNEYTAPNTVNYIAFTNHSDALPLEETDRRWWVQFTPFVDQAQLAEKAGPEYFKRLHNAIEKHAGGLRRWLMEYEIPTWFEANGQAPKSAAKSQMVSLNTSDAELAIRELIAEGAPGVCSDVVSTVHLTTALSLVDDVEVPRTSSLAKMLMKLGFSKVPSRVKWEGRPLWLWVKGTKWAKLGEADLNAAIRKKLDSTLRDELLE